MRLQLHKGFTFADASDLIPYLVDLNISHVYSSPILTARAGSIHGYDVIDTTAVNPELGGEQGFRAFVGGLRSAGLGLIVDIVPNHMAVGNSDNPWWTDMLRHGRFSRYADFFDVDWETDDSDLRGKVLAPFLGRTYGDALEAGEIRLAESASGEPVIRYYDAEFPIDPTDFGFISEHGAQSFDPAEPQARGRLHELLERQHYRLAWWATAGDEINWRRFFDINGLAGLRIEDPKVFEESHATLFRLYAEGLIDGFRVDHVDGLSDPPGYCRRLRQRLNELAPDRHAYLVIEKILGAGEMLPSDWEVDGTSGYDFMNEVSALQHDASSTAVLGALWHDLTLRSADFQDEEVAARREILLQQFDAQLRSVTAALHRLARAQPATRDISAAKIRSGLLALLSHFPVYRGYAAGSKRSETDQAAFEKALAAAKAASPATIGPVLAHLDRWLGGEPGDKVAATRFQQLSAPVAAKSVEDTAFYRYGRLLSRNDVGFDAAVLGGSVADFHQACANRLATFPNAMLATATHDHKRGEDLRARLAVISEVPDDWAAFLAECADIPAERPDPADEIMLYQMVIGAWPFDLDPSDSPGHREFEERLADWQQKALREAKLRTSWTEPNEPYETAARNFLSAVLKPSGAFYGLIRSFTGMIAPAGAVNGLAQVLLKMTVPGVPDFFQGTEFWDLSLVDPDNRRPVDYGARRRALAENLEPRNCQESWRDGRVKQAMIRTVLALRHRVPDVFSTGRYIPIPVTGPMEDHILAFGRCLGESVLVVAVPRLAYRLMAGEDRISLDPHPLAESNLVLPEALRGRALHSLLTGHDPPRVGDTLPLDSVLSDFPMAVLHGTDAA